MEKGWDLVPDLVIRLNSCGPGTNKESSFKKCHEHIYRQDSEQPLRACEKVPNVDMPGQNK